MLVVHPESLQRVGRLVLLATALTLLTACGAQPGGPPNNNEGGENRSGTLEQSLNTLGVDTAKTDRVDPGQQALPDDYAPLGASAAFGDAAEFSGQSGANETDELLLVGLIGDSRFKLLELRGVQINGDGTVNEGDVDFLHTLSEAASPWATDEGTRLDDDDVGMTFRDVAAGDIDGDGLEELVVVFLDDSSANPLLKVKIVQDQEQSYDSARENTIAGVDTNDEGEPEIFDLTVITGDLDGDGIDQVVVGVSFGDGAELLFLRGTPGEYAIEAGQTKRFSVSSPDRFLTLELATGNLDYDNPEELVVVTNEFFPGPPQIAGVARFHAYDDERARFVLLESGNVQGEDGAVYNAVVADVDVGDIDGDGLDEIVFAGLTQFPLGYEDSYPYLVVALDDSTRALAPIDAAFINDSLGSNPHWDPWLLRFVHVNAFDLDGDGIDEVQANQVVFEDLSETGTLVEAHTLPDLFTANGAYLNATTFTIVSGDVTGDGRENLTTYSQFREDIRVFGKTEITTVGDGGFTQLSTINYGETYNNQDRPRPILTTVNLDTDSPVLDYGEGSYRLVFTEPVLVAALAAAPCSEGIGQNLGACSTAFGEAESEIVSAEVTVSAKASVYVGVKTAVNVPWVGEIGADFRATVSRTASLSAGTSYTVTKSQVFTTGPLEDAVIFTSVPYDTYTYDVLVHPDPEMIGGTVTVALPRAPVLLKVERKFYNDNIVETGTPIGSNVFDHTVGILGSYPNQGRKDDLLGEHAGGSLLDLQNGPQTVGQGTGSTGRTIDVSTSVSAGGSLGIEYERSVDVTAGPALAGFSVGAGVQASLQITSGESTTYSVSVGDLDLGSEEYNANKYSYGIFAYAQKLEGQEFQVINFWVE